MCVPAILDAITRMPGMSATAADVKKEVMVWLRNAGDRNGGRTSRELAKQNRENLEDME